MDKPHHTGHRPPAGKQREKSQGKKKGKKQPISTKKGACNATRSQISKPFFTICASHSSRPVKNAINRKNWSENNHQTTTTYYRPQQQRRKTDYLELSGQSQAQRKRTKKTNTTEQQTNLELQQQIDQLKTESDQQKQQIRDLKRDKKQAKDENTKLKAKINELEKQASALKAQQKKSQEEIKNLKDINNRATDNQTEQTTTQNNIITRLEKDIEELQNTIQDLSDTQAENETTINNLRCDLEEATQQQQQQQPQEEQDEIRTLKQKLKEAEEMTELLVHKLDEQTDRDEDTLTIETTTKPKCLLIADSNRREIIPYLDHDLAIWHHENEIFTIEQLEKWTNNEDLPQDYDHIIISQGTNDIRYGKDGYRMAKRMASTINQLEKDLPQTTISVLDLPPLKNNDNNKEISLYNFTLAREKTTTTISKKMRDEDTRDILRGDGIHLTPRGGEIAAREINKLVTNNNNNNPKQQTTKVTANIPIPIPETTAESWYIPRKTGSTIIGKGGANIRKIQEKHSVSVHLHDQEKDSDDRRITVKGRQQNVNNARDGIEQIVYNYSRPQQQQKTKVRKDTECRYYNQGYCKMGNKCDFAHWTPKPKTQQKSNSPVPSTSRQSRNEKRGQPQRSTATHPRSRSPLGRY